MYHCFVEGIAPATAAASSCPSGVSGASFSSLTSLPSLLALGSSEFFFIFHQPADYLCANRIGQKEINPKKRYRHRNHDGGGNHVRARRPVHLPHFHAHFVQKRAKTLRIPAQLPRRLQKRKSAYAMGVFVSIRAYRVGHFTPCPSPSTLSTDSAAFPARFIATKLAGEEELDPPLSVLETDGLPLTLPPFPLRPRQWRVRRVYAARPGRFSRSPAAIS